MESTQYVPYVGQQARMADDVLKDFALIDQIRQATAAGFLLELRSGPISLLRKDLFDPSSERRQQVEEKIGQYDEPDLIEAAEFRPRKVQHSLDFKAAFPFVVLTAPRRQVERHHASPDSLRTVAGDSAAKYDGRTCHFLDHQPPLDRGNHAILSPVILAFVLCGFPTTTRAPAADWSTIYGSAREEARQISSSSLAAPLSPAQWQASVDQRREMWREMIGLSPLPPRTPLDATVTGMLERGDYVVEKIHFQSVPGAYVIGNLYRPAKITGRLPAVLYLCGHTKGKVNAPYQANPRWFGQHGYVALVLDPIQLGESQGFHHGTSREGRWDWHSRGYTPAGTEVWNAMRALDYLETRPDVDGESNGRDGAQRRRRHLVVPRCCRRAGQGRRSGLPIGQHRACRRRSGDRRPLRLRLLDQLLPLVLARHRRPDRSPGISDRLRLRGHSCGGPTAIAMWPIASAISTRRWAPATISTSSRT